MTDQNPKPTEREVVANYYGGVDHPAGPTIYTRADMHDAIFDLGQFGALPRGAINRFVDLMAGPKCLVASEVRKRAEREGIPIEAYCLDVAFDSMDPQKRADLEAQGYKLSCEDITQGTGYPESFFTRAAARFGVKNYPTETQIEILREARQILVPGGVFVLADMVTTVGSYDWSQEERRRKSRHTIGEEHAHHHIPTLKGWFDILHEAGLEPNEDDVYQTKSFVITTNWVTSKQMGEEGMQDMNRFLLEAPEHAKRDFNIREDEADGKKVVKIDYPVVVIAARVEPYRGF